MAQRRRTSARHASICIRRFLRAEDGVTAVEFALVAFPFFALLFAIVQTSLVMFAGQALQGMTTDASRKVMTGQIQAANGLQAFKDALCGPNAFMFNCNKLRVQVQSYTNFGAADPSSAGFVNNDCFNLEDEDEPPAACWNPGGARDVVIVRVAYDWPFALNLETLSSSHTLVAIAAFRSEPF